MQIKPYQRGTEMKLIAALVLTMMTSTSFATSILASLQSGTCKLDVKKNIVVTPNGGIKKMGRVFLAPLIEEGNFVLKKGIQEIAEFDDAVIVLNERKNTSFSCIVDDTEECVGLDTVETSDLLKLSNGWLELICE